MLGFPFAAAPVAQLDRASASGAEGCRFEPYRAYQLINAQGRTRERKFLARNASSLQIGPPHAERVVGIVMLIRESHLHGAGGNEPDLHPVQVIVASVKL